MSQCFEIQRNLTEGAREAHTHLQMKVNEVKWSEVKVNEVS